MLDGPEHHSNHHTMMNCTDVREKLALYVGNDLDQESQRFVGAHLALCESCAREARSAERAREVLVSSFAPGPADLRTDLWDAIRAELLAEGRLSGAPGTPAGVAENPSVPGAAASRKSTGGTANLRPVAARPGPRPLRRLVPLAAAAAVLFVATAVAPRFMNGHDTPTAPGAAEVAQPAPAAGAGGFVADAVLPPEASTMGLRVGEVKLQPVFGTSLLEQSRALRDEPLLLPTSSGPNALAGYGGPGRIVR